MAYTDPHQLLAEKMLDEHDRDLFLGIEEVRRQRQFFYDPWGLTRDALTD
jgi:hypothetical protein